MKFLTRIFSWKTFFSTILFKFVDLTLNLARYLAKFAKIINNDLGGSSRFQINLPWKVQTSIIFWFCEISKKLRPNLARNLGVDQRYLEKLKNIEAALYDPGPYQITLYWNKVLLGVIGSLKFTVGIGLCPFCLAFWQNNLKKIWMFAPL